MEKELREIIKKYEWYKRQEKLIAEDLVKIFTAEDIIVLLSLAQSYLDIKGWPELPEDFATCNCHQCSRVREIYNLCKLASLKDKVEVMSEEELEKFLIDYTRADLIDAEVEKILSQKINPNLTITEIQMKKDCAKLKCKYLAHALSGKISKPKKIGREEIRKILKENISCSYHHTEEIENTITAILKFLDDKEV